MTTGSMFGSRQRQSFGQKLLRVPWTLVLLLAVVAAAGVATLYSVAGGALEPWATRHAARFLFGIVLALGIALVPLETWLRLAYPLYAMALVLLLIVPFAGTESLGARRWLSLGGFSLQPAEVMKVALVAALARYYHMLPAARVSRPLWVAAPLLMIAVPVALTLKQPDLGTATLFAGVGLGLMLLAGVSGLYALAGSVAAIAAAPAIWSSLHAYQRRRIEIFLDPEKDPLGAGYHIAQSKIALGSGGLSGRGYIQGSQSQLDFVPEKHTDFIFTMFAEEWGFVGACALLAVYSVLLFKLLAMARGGGSVFGRLLVAGAALSLFVYAFVNTAMVTGLLPVVGVPLPLFSYGGTSMITLLSVLGLAMSAQVHARDVLPGPPRPPPAWTPA